MMFDYADTTLALRPEHLAVLAAAAAEGVIGAEVWSGGKLQEAGFDLFGRLEFLANCGLVEFLERVGSASSGTGDVRLYYAVTRRGRILLRWRYGNEAPVSCMRPAADKDGVVHRSRSWADAYCCGSL